MAVVYSAQNEGRNEKSQQLKLLLAVQTHPWRAGRSLCGRFCIVEEEKDEELQCIIDLMNRKYNGNPRIKTKGEIRQTDTIVTIANGRLMQQGVFAICWGYTMPDGKSRFNVRSETAAVKILFADGA